MSPYAIEQMAAQRMIVGSVTRNWRGRKRESRRKDLNVNFWSDDSVLRLSCPVSFLIFATFLSRREVARLSFMNSAATAEMPDAMVAI